MSVKTFSVGLRARFTAKATLCSHRHLFTR
jgi:hypothetical protein